MVSLAGISRKFIELNIFHKTETNFIITKLSKTFVPRMNKDISYLTGVLTGDGSLIRTKRKKGGFHYTVQITADSVDYLNYLNSLFMKYFNFGGKVTKDERKFHTYNLRIMNATVFWYFVLTGLPIGKKIELKVPNVVKPKELISHYLAGLVDTDGHIDSKRIQLKQKNENFLIEIHNILNKLKLNCAIPKVNYTDSKPFYYIRFDNNLPIRVPQ